MNLFFHRDGKKSSIGGFTLLEISFTCRLVSSVSDTQKKVSGQFDLRRKHLACLHFYCTSSRQNTNDVMNGHLFHKCFLCTWYSMCNARSGSKQTCVSTRCRKPFGILTIIHNLIPPHEGHMRAFFYPHRDSNPQPPAKKSHSFSHSSNFRLPPHIIP